MPLQILLQLELSFHN